MDMRLLDIDEWEERAEIADDEDGEVDRGVDVSEEKVMARANDAIACGKGGIEREE